MKHYTDEMPLYAAGQLNQTEAAEVRAHLSVCSRCRAELAFWQNLALEINTENADIAAPAALVQKALAQIRTGKPMPENFKSSNTPTRFIKACQSAFSLLRAQAYLVRREIWPASAGIMTLGVCVALLSNHAGAISFIAPLMAAACMASLYGSENDPAYELTQAAPTSSWKILLARLSVVSANNLLLSLLASLAMLLIVPSNMLGVLILGWLGPLALLSSLALILSLWIGTGNAIVVSYGLWILQYVQISKILVSRGITSSVDTFLTAYRNFWQSPELLLVSSLVLVVLALLSTRFIEHGLPQTPA